MVAFFFHTQPPPYSLVTVPPSASLSPFLELTIFFNGEPPSPDSAIHARWLPEEENVRNSSLFLE